MPRHPMILRGIATALLGCLLGGMALPAAEGPTSGENYVYDSSHRMPLEELIAKHRDKAWEIKAIFPHQAGHLGTYRVGDLIGGGYLHFSIGPVGVDGEGAYVQEKPFSRGMPVLPVLCLMDQGQVVERLPFDKNYCCGGLPPYAMRVGSQAKPGRHQIRVTWDYPQRKIPERVFTFDVVNPDFGKPVNDAELAALQARFPGALAAVLQQGMPCQTLGLNDYQGCKDAWMSSEAFAHGASRWLKTGLYQFDHAALLRFDLPALPQGAILESAQLRLHTFLGGRSTDRVAYRMLRAWEAGTGVNGAVQGGFLIENTTAGGNSPKEGECGWMYARRPERWGQLGAAKSGVDREEAPLAAGRPVPDPASPAGEARAWIVWDVTAAARDWVAAPERNFGLQITTLGGKGGMCAFASSESIDPQNRPQLVLIYRPAR